MVIIHVYNTKHKFQLKPILESKINNISVLDFSINKQTYVDISINNILVDYMIIDDVCIADFDKRWTPELLDSKKIKKILFDIGEPKALRELIDNLREICSKNKSKSDEKMNENLRDK